MRFKYEMIMIQWTEDKATRCAIATIKQDLYQVVKLFIGLYVFINIIFGMGCVRAWKKQTLS